MELRNEATSGIGGSGTLNQIAYWVDSDTLGSLTTATYPSLTELSYVKGVTSAIQTQLNSKQATLVSGTNIKTINSTSLLGSGDIAISASPGGSDTQVQFNDSSAFAGDAQFTFNKTSGLTTITGAGNTGVALFKAVTGSGTSSVQINDNGTMVIDSDVGTGTFPLTLKYNGTIMAQFSHPGSLILGRNGVQPTLTLGQNTGSSAGILNFSGGYADIRTIGTGGTDTYLRLATFSTTTAGHIALMPGALSGSGGVGVGTVSPTALLHIKAGTATANTAPLKFTSGTLNTTAEAGAVEFLTDDFYATITTGAARKGIVLNDGTALTSGRVPFATTNGRLTDDADFTFATDTLTATKIVGTTSIKVGTAAGYISSDGSTGATGTFTSADAKTITVKDGIITSIV